MEYNLALAAFIIILLWLLYSKILTNIKTNQNLKESHPCTAGNMLVYLQCKQ